MATNSAAKTTVGVFETRAAAEKAVADLRAAGYQDDQIGLVAKNAEGETVRTDGAGSTHAGEGAMIGVATGAGVAGLVSLGVSFGVIPVIGPILAMGPLAAALVSAVGGAAAAGLAGALIGWGIPEDEAKFYEGEVNAGRYLVTVTGLDQRRATSLTASTVVLALVMAVLFTRLADSRWRDRLFVVAAVLQVAAFATGAVSGGVALRAMLAVALLYGLSSVFAGEAAYKVWAQLLFPDHVRATAYGVTYGVARLGAALFLTVVPQLISVSPRLLMAVLTGCVLVSGSLGLAILRHPALSEQLRGVGPAR